MSDFAFFRHLWSSPWTGWIGVRYLKSKKNSRFLSFITILSVLGVGLGVASMIVVLSVMDGFEAELKKRLMGTDLHILITPTTLVSGFEGGMVPDDSLDLERIRSGISDRAQIDTMYPVLSTEAILKAGRKVTGVIFKGVPGDRLDKVQQLVVERAKPESFRDGGSDSQVKLPGVLVGQELAYEMGLIAGDHVTLISPTETEGPMSSVPRLKRFVVEGIYHSGLPDQELHTIFATDGAVSSFLRRAKIVSQWEVTVKDFDQAPLVADEIRKQNPQFKVQDWIQLNSNLFWSLKLERVSMFVILAFIVIVASFNIVTTLTLMVLEKKREISILRAMGAREGAVAAIFLSEGLLIGGLGIAGGMALGFGVCVILRKYEFIQLPDVFYDRTLPVTFDARYYIGVGLCALIIVLVACLYPSRRAARLEPLEGIRFG
ncbi:MAG: FtsX-like permease family protein [Bdellovibrionia bacterium]